MAEGEEMDKHGILINNVSSEVFSFISGAKPYEDAMEILNNVYIRPKNTVFARFCLKDRRQALTESMDDYLRQLYILAKDCDYKDVSAQQHQEESIRDAFIAGICTNEIRQRLLEQTGTLETIFQKARSLEQAHKNNERITSSADFTESTINSLLLEKEGKGDNVVASMAFKKKGLNNSNSAGNSEKCFFCGYERHPRARCPARDKSCILCSKVGNFATVCNSNVRKEQVHNKLGDNVSSQSRASNSHLSALSSRVPDTLKDSVVNVKVNETSLLFALIDTGSSDSFISYKHVKFLKLKVYECNRVIIMAANNHSSSVMGHCFVYLEFEGHKHPNTK